MKFLNTYSVRPGCVEAAAKRFLSGQAQPPEGIKLLGRWHKADFSGGSSLFECNDPAVLYAFSATWADVLDMTTVPVVEDAEAGAALAARFGG